MLPVINEIDKKDKKYNLLSICDTLEACTFASKMYLYGHNREKRHGQSVGRSSYEIFCDNMRGKISEMALRNETIKYLDVSDEEKLNILKTNLQVDSSIHGLGVSDDGIDLKFYEKNISVKSTKTFGNYLLLEQSNYDKNGFYIHRDGKETNELISYDVIALLNVGFFKDNKPVEIEKIYNEFSKFNKENTGNYLRKIYRYIKSEKIYACYNFLGWLDRKTFAQAINDPYHCKDKGDCIRNTSTMLKVPNFEIHKKQLNPVSLYATFVKTVYDNKRKSE